jgi:hypothetical protein
MHSSSLTSQPALPQLLGSTLSKLGGSSVCLSGLWVVRAFDTGVIHQ